jgi:NAD(P) transhydrogenase subunit alpha
MAGTVCAVVERVPGERRVALTPEIAKKLRAAGLTVVLEKGAGVSAAFPDTAYIDVEFVDSAAAALARADVLLKVQPPE